MAAPGNDESFSFCPSEKQLVQRYLRARLEGNFSDDANAAYFLDADVCSARPQDLVSTHAKAARVSTKEAGDGRQWFFFSPVRFLHKSTKKRARTIAGTDEKECWHVEGRQNPVDGGGYVQKFSYHVKIGPKAVEKPGWIMAEYGLVDNKDGDTVLCKVYRSPRGPGRSNKRKAADDPVAATSTSTTRRPRHQTEEAGGHDPLPVPVQDQAAAAAAAPMFAEPLLHVEEGPPKPPPLHAPVFGEVAALQFGETSTTRRPRHQTQEAGGHDPLPVPVQVQVAAAAPMFAEPPLHVKERPPKPPPLHAPVLGEVAAHVFGETHDVEEMSQRVPQELFEQDDPAVLTEACHQDAAVPDVAQMVHNLEEIEPEFRLCDMLNIDYDDDVPEVTDQEFQNYYAAFKEDIERRAAVSPEVVAETVPVEENQPMPETTHQASMTLEVMLEAKLEDLNKMLMAEEDYETLEVPDGEDRKAYYAYESLLFGNNQQQDAAIEPVHAPLSDDQ